MFKYWFPFNEILKKRINVQEEVVLNLQLDIQKLNDQN
jgi:hypothetical protein